MMQTRLSETTSFIELFAGVGNASPDREHLDLDLDRVIRRIIQTLDAHLYSIGLLHARKETELCARRILKRATNPIDRVRDLEKPRNIAQRLRNAREDIGQLSPIWIKSDRMPLIQHYTSQAEKLIKEEIKSRHKTDSDNFNNIRQCRHRRDLCLTIFEEAYRSFRIELDAHNIRTVYDLIDNSGNKPKTETIESYLSPKQRAIIRDNVNADLAVRRELERIQQEVGAKREREANARAQKETNQPPADLQRLADIARLAIEEMADREQAAAFAEEIETIIQQHS